VKITHLSIPDVLVIEPMQFRDDRGVFSEIYNRRVFADSGLRFDWVQDNHAMSQERGTLRGLHFQSPPHAQAKLIRVTSGSIFDVAVDMRTGSPTFGEWVSVVLSASAWKLILVPKGFAHGYLTLEPDTGILYKVDDYYAPQSDAGVIWNDPDLSIDWPLDGSAPILSNKDHSLPRLSELQVRLRG
jgi:dTDP-4-dehydrorhamnose 3,5-epimerase